MASPFVRSSLRVGLAAWLMAGLGACAPAEAAPPIASPDVVMVAAPAPSVSAAAAAASAPPADPAPPPAGPSTSRRVRGPAPDWAAMMSPPLVPTEDSGLAWDGRGPAAIVVKAPPVVPPPPPSTQVSLIASLGRCYATRLAENPGLQGSLRVKVVVARDGTLESATLERSSTGDDVLDRCVVEVVRRATFSPYDGDHASLIIPLTFMP